MILVDRIIYTRERDAQGAWGPWNVTQPRTPAGSAASDSDEAAGGESGARSIDPPSSTFCGVWPLSDVQYLGTATIGDDNTSVKHYKAYFDDTVVGGPSGTYENYEYWIDSSGAILQARSESYDPADCGPDHHIDVVITFSGHGEANVITAPVIPE